MARRNKTIIRLLEENGFYVKQEDDGQWLIHQYTPAGEDWSFYLEDLHNLPEYADNFDVDEEFEMWVEAKRNGVSGVPSYRDLLEDQEWKQKILKEVAELI